jgi:hypothetical protein
MSELETTVEFDIEVEDASGDPWQGIPAEVLDGEHAYDSDSAGGCG